MIAMSRTAERRFARRAFPRTHQPGLCLVVLLVLAHSAAAQDAPAFTVWYSHLGLRYPPIYPETLEGDSDCRFDIEPFSEDAATLRHVFGSLIYTDLGIGTFNPNEVRLKLRAGILGTFIVDRFGGVEAELGDVTKVLELNKWQLKEVEQLADDLAKQSKCGLYDLAMRGVPCLPPSISQGTAINSARDYLRTNLEYVVLERLNISVAIFGDKFLVEFTPKEPAQGGVYQVWIDGQTGRALRWIAFQ